jgi:hypothetical protein
VGSPESMSLGLEFNDLSIIQNEGEEEGDPAIMREGNVWSSEVPRPVFACMLFIRLLFVYIDV